MSKTNPKIAIYTRVSTDMQSTENQIDTLKAYCKARGWTQIELYDDIGYSGTTDKRPAFKRLINDYRKRKVDVVLCLKLDRFFRSLQHLIVTLKDFDDLGVNFIALNDNIDMTTAAGRLMMHIIGAFAEFESEVIRERVTAGVRAKIKKTGNWGRKISVNVKKIKALREKGWSMGEIAKKLKISKSSVHKYLKV